MNNCAEELLNKFEELPNIFNDDQINQILFGLYNGLTKNQIKVYANSKYDYLQMEQIRLGFENGLSIEQVMIYADSKFNEEQMYEIRWGFKKGLSIEQVKTYANPEFSADQMEQIRLRLEELIKAQFKVYIKWA